MLNRHSPRTGDRGIAFSVVALLLLVLLGISGLVLDLGSWQVRASRMQQAADAAALAGVVRLPRGDSAAQTRALSVAADNGFVDGVDGITVTVDTSRAETVAVTITDADVEQYFTSVFRPAPTLVRTGTAQYIQPVPMGSPRNYLGTGDLLNGLVDGPGVGEGDGVENFFLAVSGPCTRREWGDRLMTKAEIIPLGSAGDPYSCDPDTAPRIHNPEYEPRGYVFGVDVPDASTGPVSIDVFDPGYCGASRTGDPNYGPFDGEFSVRRADSLDPYAGSLVPGAWGSDAQYVIDGDVGTGGDCASGPLEGTCPNRSTTRDCWLTLATVSTPGVYYVQYRPIDNGDDSTLTAHNYFSLRAREGAAFTPCTSDDSVPAGTNPAHSATCPQVYALEHLPVVARNIGEPIFFLNSVDNRQNGKTMEVTLFDTAEGADRIRIVDPAGNDVTFNWTIPCNDGTTAAPMCSYDGITEQEPDGGRSGGPTSFKDVAGSGTQPYPTNIQPGLYSDRLMRLTFQLPADIDTAYSGRSWFKIEYEGSFTADRTTWSVRILGDPVRLVPNAAPAGP